MPAAASMLASAAITKSPRLSPRSFKPISSPTSRSDVAVAGAPEAPVVSAEAEATLTASARTSALPPTDTPI